MKIEYLKEGSRDCPLIRIWGDEPDRVKDLKMHLEKLVEGKVREIALHHIIGFESVDQCTLMAGW